MAQRLVRAKRKIKAAGHPVSRSTRPLAAGTARARCSPSSTSSSTRGTAAGSICLAEAIRLGRALTELMPDEPEARGLLALMLLHDARREARFADGELVVARQAGPLPLGRQPDRRGTRLELERALASRGRGPYVVQAAIAALHTDEPRDRAQIAAFYGELSRLTGSPVVELNRAVAVAEAGSPAAGLAALDGL